MASDVVKKGGIIIQSEAGIPSSEQQAVCAPKTPEPEAGASLAPIADAPPSPAVDRPEEHLLETPPKVESLIRGRRNFGGKIIRYSQCQVCDVDRDLDFRG